MVIYLLRKWDLSHLEQALKLQATSLSSPQAVREGIDSIPRQVFRNHQMNVQIDTTLGNVFLRLPYKIEAVYWFYSCICVYSVKKAHDKQSLPSGAFSFTATETISFDFSVMLLCFSCQMSHSELTQVLVRIEIISGLSIFALNTIIITT